MPLPMLLDFPKAKANDMDVGMLEWATSHRYDHRAILDAIQTQYGLILPEYQIDPMVFTNDSQFLLWNQQMHSDMNAVLGLSGSDISSIDFNDKSQIQNWLFTHYQEHNAAHAKLRI